VAVSKPVAPECSCQGPNSDVPISSVGSCQEHAGTTGFSHAGTTKWFGFETPATSSGVSFQNKETFSPQAAGNLTIRDQTNNNRKENQNDKI
jgi:hypothetical protein